MTSQRSSCSISSNIHSDKGLILDDEEAQAGKTLRSSAHASTLFLGPTFAVHGSVSVQRRPVGS